MNGSHVVTYTEKYELKLVRYEVFTAVKIKIVICLVMTLNNFIGGYQHFRGPAVCPDDGDRRFPSDIDNHLWNYMVSDLMTVIHSELPNHD
jgi:hypothetical protein